MRPSLGKHNPITCFLLRFNDAAAAAADDDDDDVDNNNCRSRRKRGLGNATMSLFGALWSIGKAAPSPAELNRVESRLALLSVVNFALPAKFPIRALPAH